MIAKPCEMMPEREREKQERKTNGGERDRHTEGGEGIGNWEFGFQCQQIT
jgi:hypothetical protein